MGLNLRLIILLKELVKHLSSKRGCSLSVLASCSGLSEDFISEYLSNFSTVSVKGGYVYASNVSEFLVECWLNNFNLVEVALNAGWRDVEGLCAALLARYGYEIKRNFNFKFDRRYEVDVIGLKEPVILAVDCKRLRRAPPSKLREAAIRQLERAEALARALLRRPSMLPIRGWRHVEVWPIVVPLVAAHPSIEGGVPIVPIYTLRDFLEKMYAIADQVKRFKVPIRVQSY